MKEKKIRWFKSKTLGFVIPIFKIIATVIGLIIIFIPVELMIGLTLLLKPNTYWEKFALYVAGLCILGIPQMILGIIGLMFIVQIWLMTE